MAEAAKSKDAEGEADVLAKPAGNKRKLIMFAVIGIVAVAVAAGGAFFMMKKKKGAEEGDGTDGSAEVSAKEEKGHEQPPVYAKLEPFTTNLAMESADQPSGTAGQYIQVVVELKMEDAPSGEKLKDFMPEIRNNILRLLSARKPSQLAATEGKDELANEIQDSVNNVIEPGSKKGSKAAKGPVKAVLFSSFIIQ